MRYEQEQEYKKLKYKPIIGDIVYKGKYYRWNDMNSKDFFNVGKEEYIILEIEDKIPGIWSNYLIENIETKQQYIEQTHYTLYEKERFNKIRNKSKPKQLTIFDFLEV